MLLTLLWLQAFLIKAGKLRKGDALLQQVFVAAQMPWCHYRAVPLIHYVHTFYWAWAAHAAARRLHHGGGVPGAHPEQEENENLETAFQR